MRFGEKCVMLHEEKEGFMPTQDERLSTVEQSMVVLRKSIAGIQHNETILLGVMSEQGKDIREMKVSLAVLNERVGTFEQGVHDRFEVLEGRLDPFEQGVRDRFEILQGHLISFEQSVTSRLGEQDTKLDDLGRLLLQVLDRLPPA
jgi:hypothetical protein